MGFGLSLEIRGNIFFTVVFLLNDPITYIITYTSHKRGNYFSQISLLLNAICCSAKSEMCFGNCENLFAQKSFDLSSGICESVFLFGILVYIQPHHL